MEEEKKEEDQEIQVDEEHSVAENENEQKIEEEQSSTAEPKRPGRFLRFVRDLDAKLEKVFALPEVPGESED